MRRARMPERSEPKPNEDPSPRTSIADGPSHDPGGDLPPVPTGIQRLLQMAAVDATFRDRLVDRRGAAAAAVGVTLTPSEQAILAAIPADTLVEMSQHVPAPSPVRRDFLRHAAASAAVLLGGAALGTAASGCRGCPPTQGSRPDLPPERPEHNEMQRTGGAAPDPPPPRPTQNPMAPGGARPDVAEDDSENVAPPRPTQLPVTKGIRPDMPGSQTKP